MSEKGREGKNKQSNIKNQERSHKNKSDDQSSISSNIAFSMGELNYEDTILNLEKLNEIEQMKNDLTHDETKELGDTFSLALKKFREEENEIPKESGNSFCRCGKAYHRGSL